MHTHIIRGHTHAQSGWHCCGEAWLPAVTWHLVHPHTLLGDLNSPSPLREETCSPRETGGSVPTEVSETSPMLYTQVGNPRHLVPFLSLGAFSCKQGECAPHRLP